LAQVTAFYSTCVGICKNCSTVCDWSRKSRKLPFLTNHILPSVLIFTQNCCTCGLSSF